MALILCVEDEESIREDIVDELRDAGHTVIEAGNGVEGLEQITKHHPDLVLSDITMPQMDGLTFLKTLREKHAELYDLPFIFLSALSDRKDEMRGRELGVDDYLIKPIDFDMLLVTVKARVLRTEMIKKQKEAEFVRLYQNLKTPSDKEAAHS